MNISYTKIIFFDIDGTLLKLGDPDLSKRTKETLLKLKNNNILICIATGRGPFVIPKFDGIEFDAYISFNGSYCIAGNDEIFKNPISKNSVHKIIENGKSIGRPVALATSKKVRANGTDKDLEDYFSISHQEVIIEDDFDKFASEEIFQIMCGGLEEEHDLLMKDVDGAQITAWWPRAVDIIPKSGSKALGIEKTLEYFQLKKEQSLAFGDGSNDIEMLRAVGHGVAMGNASNEVKAISDEVCDSVENDGIYKFCKEYGLIE